MYTLLVNDDNTIFPTKKERIVQRSKLCDNIGILVPLNYKDKNMQEFEVTMLYELPISQEQYSISLIPENEIYQKYEEYFLRYIIPADTWITKEFGNVSFTLTFTKVEMSENAEVSQYVRKATGGIIEIAKCSDWASKIADPLLQTIDQRIIQLQMVAKQMDEISQYIYDNKADDLSYENNKLWLLANGNKIGSPATITSTGAVDESGVPIVDFSNIRSSNSVSSATANENYKVIEF